MARNKVVNGYEFVTYSVNRHFQLFYSETIPSGAPKSADCPYEGFKTFYDLD